ncbi:MAG: hypothetical protein VX346_18945 [Planctomycetota bacterium]|nr:hypothetical protein [Planctomycetota bacterium]
MSQYIVQRVLQDFLLPAEEVSIVYVSPSVGSQREEVCWRFPVRELVEEVCQNLATRLSMQRVVLRVEVPPAIAIVADRELLFQAIETLVDGWLNVTEDGGHLTIGAFPGPFGLEIELAVAGPGIESCNLQELFVPAGYPQDQTVTPSFNAVREVLELHHGCLEVGEDSRGGGAVTLIIPDRELESAD